MFCPLGCIPVSGLVSPISSPEETLVQCQALQHEYLLISSDLPLAFQPFVSISFKLSLEIFLSPSLILRRIQESKKFVWEVILEALSGVSK